MRYPAAEWVPWKYSSPDGRATYYKGLCAPVSVVLHVMAGYASTARRWATEGHYGASWHFTVALDGHVMQHLELTDGGYHAGIPTTAPAPTWLLWKGHSTNVNLYTIGIEREGFPGAPSSADQDEATRDLCRWLAETLLIPFDRDHFPPHADIDIVNRPNDFNTPALREEFYAFLLEDEMTPEEKKMLQSCYDALVGRGNPDGIVRLEKWNENGNSLLDGYTLEQQKLSRHIHVTSTPDFLLKE